MFRILVIVIFILTAIFPSSGFAEKLLPRDDCDVGELELAVFKDVQCYLDEGEPTKFRITTSATAITEEEETTAYSWAKPTNKNWRHVQECRWEPRISFSTEEEVVDLHCRFAQMGDGANIHKTVHDLKIQFAFNPEGSINQRATTVSLIIDGRVFRGRVKPGRKQTFEDACRSTECSISVRKLDIPRLDDVDDILLLDLTLSLPVTHRESKETRHVELTYHGFASRDPSVLAHNMVSEEEAHRRSQQANEALLKFSTMSASVLDLGMFRLNNLLGRLTDNPKYPKEFSNLSAYYNKPGNAIDIRTAAEGVALDPAEAEILCARWIRHIRLRAFVDPLRGTVTGTGVSFTSSFHSTAIPVHELVDYMRKLDRAFKLECRISFPKRSGSSVQSVTLKAPLVGSSYETETRMWN